MNYKSYSDLSHDIKSNVHKINFQNFDLIVGVPRSGMVPAYMVSLLLNVHCIDFPAFIRNEKLVRGITRDVASNIVYAQDAKNILLIDDSVLSGKSMQNTLQKIPSEFPGKITTVAVYSSEKKHKGIDITLSYVSLPRVFEWNIYHHKIVSNSCFDIDGVLCYDPLDEQNDDGEKYIDFIKNATPRFIPTVKIDVLVTNRLEKYRNETEAWLCKHGVKYNTLIMLPLNSKEDRLSQSDYYAHKSNFYKKSNTYLFVESDINQAIEIANRSNKFVFCVDDNLMVSPGTLKKFKSKGYLISKFRNKFNKNNLIYKVYYFFKKNSR